MPKYMFPFVVNEWNQENPKESLVSEVKTPFLLSLLIGDGANGYAELEVESCTFTEKKLSQVLHLQYNIKVLAGSKVRKKVVLGKMAELRNTFSTELAEWRTGGVEFTRSDNMSGDSYETQTDVSIGPISLSTLVNMLTGKKTSAPKHLFLRKNKHERLEQWFSFIDGTTAEVMQKYKEATDEIQTSNGNLKSVTNIKDDISQSQLYADILMRRKNIVLEGPPGTGKTYAIKGIVKALRENYGRPIGGEGKGEFAITMHPATSYEDFIEGLRPNGEGSFTYQPGVFTEIVRKAIQEPDKDHVVLLDELNRSNVPRVMGDLLTTLEASKRTKQKEIAEEEDLIEGEQSLNYVTFSEEEREGAQSTGFRHAVNAAWKNIVQNEHEQFRYYRNKTGHEHELKVVENADLTRTRKKREFAGDLGFTHSIRLDEVKSGAAFLVINKILHPILDEAWANRLFDESMESPETTMRVWSPGGVVNLEVLENSETGKANLAPYGTIKVRKSQPTCKKDTESKHYFWSEGCDALWADDRRVEVKLSGSKKRLHVPQNLLVIGTMNTTDRSVAPLDAALRRRFVFLRVDPDESITTSILCKEAGGKISDEGKFRLENSLKIWKKVNTLLRSHLGQDATIGHSYFFDLATELVDVRDSDRAHYLERQAWKYAVLPQVADLLDSTGRANKLLADDSGLKKLNDHIKSLGLELNAGEGANRMYARTMVKTLPIETPKTVEEDITGDSEDGEDTPNVDA